MGTTITLALLTWFATSYMEWRMGRQSETIHKILVNPFFGIAFSVFLGSVTFSVAGSGVGVGVVIGNLLGLATNELTFNFFTALAQLWHSSARLGNHVKAFWNQNIEAMRTVANFFRTIFHLIGQIINIILLPFKALNWLLAKTERKVATP